MVKKWLSRIKYRNMLLFISILMFLGFIFGIAYYLNLSSDMKESIVTGLVTLKDSLSSATINNIFIHLLIEIVIIIASFTVVGLIFVYFYLFFETLSIGFSICAIIDVLGFKSILFSILYFLFYKVLYLILLIFFVMRVSRISKNILGLLFYRNSKDLKNNIIINLRKVLIVLIIIFLLDVILFAFSPLINKLLLIFL